MKKKKEKGKNKTEIKEIKKQTRKEIKTKKLTFSSGFYQQIDHNNFNHSIKEYLIEFVTSVDIHIEVGYNFLLGKKKLRIRGKDENKKKNNKSFQMENEKREKRNRKPEREEKKN